MNIIEAMQKAEQGKLITNNFLTGQFLRYVGNGEFHQYQIVEEEVIFRFKVRVFTLAFILTTAWEVVEKDYFNK